MKNTLAIILAVLGVACLTLTSHGESVGYTRQENRLLQTVQLKNIQEHVLQKTEVRSVRNRSHSDESTMALYTAKAGMSLERDTAGGAVMSVRMSARVLAPNWGPYAWSGFAARTANVEYSARILVDGKEICAIEQENNPIMQCMLPSDTEKQIYVLIDASNAAAGYTVRLVRLEENAI
jgi:hypothetical protein